MDRIDKKLAQAVVLLDRQYLLTDHLIKNRHDVLHDFENAVNEGKEALSHVLDVYNYVFGLIDHLVRYQKIAMVLPRLNQRDPEYRAFNHAMGDLRDIRDQFQHINNDIENENSGPLLGAVCWASGQRQYMASFHDIGRNRSSPGLFFDRERGVHIGGFSYVYNEKRHDLDKAMEGLHTFNKFINATVHLEIDGKVYDTKDHFMAVCIGFQRTSKAAEEAPSDPPA